MIFRRIRNKLDKMLRGIYFRYLYEYKIGIAYGIIPVNYKYLGNSRIYPSDKIVGFWGIIFKLFGINYKGKLYLYYGSYYKYIYDRYIKKCFTFDIDIKF